MSDASPAAPSAEQAVEHTITGDVRLHEDFHSRFLEHDRSIVVYLPPGYHADSADRYPVLYLHDGQNIFDRATSFGEEWHADESAQALIAAGEVAPVIIVGIYNTGEYRVDEYTPTSGEKGRGGRADEYGQMLIEELKPFIDQTYKTLPSAASTALGGSSLGGLLTMHLGLRWRCAMRWWPRDGCRERTWFTSRRRVESTTSRAGAHASVTCSGFFFRPPDAPECTASTIAGTTSSVGGSSSSAWTAWIGRAGMRCTSIRTTARTTIAGTTPICGMRFCR